MLARVGVPLDALSRLSVHASSSSSPSVRILGCRLSCQSLLLGLVLLPVFLGRFPGLGSHRGLLFPPRGVRSYRACYCLQRSVLHEEIFSWRAFQSYVAASFFSSFVSSSFDYSSLPALYCHAGSLAKVLPRPPSWFWWSLLLVVF